ncbi:MAG: uroporphyrinogen decarboxylase [Alphaproteobacteria bacterium]|nr:uroporphyrinogen decarboxylase [Alphaproteobacteria bacterium]
MSVSEKPLIDALTGKQPAALPIWLMRQAGRYLPEYRALRDRAGSFLDLCYTPALAAEVTLQPVRRFGMDGAILFSDILVLPHALGQSVKFVDGEGPVLDPIRTTDKLQTLRLDRVALTTAPVMETIRLVCQSLPSHCALIGFAGAPWTVATYMVEGGSSRAFETIRSLAYGDRPFIAALIDLLVAGTIKYLIDQVRAGAEIVQLFDTWAGVLPENEFRMWCIAPTKLIVAALRAEDPRVPIIGFPRGGGRQLERYVDETGVDAIGLDATVPLDHAKQLQQRTTVQGNLDPLLLRQGGTALTDEVNRITGVLGRRRFVFNLGHGIVPDTPPEHVAALVRQVREQGAG